VYLYHGDQCWRQTETYRHPQDPGENSAQTLEACESMFDSPIVPPQASRNDVASLLLLQCSAKKKAS